MASHDALTTRLMISAGNSTKGMTPNKLTEGIRNFCADVTKLDQYARARMTQQMAS